MGFDSPKTVVLETTETFDKPIEARRSLKEKAEKFLRRKIGGKRLKEHWHKGIWGIHVHEQEHLDKAPDYQAHAHLCVDGDDIEKDKLNERWDYQGCGEAKIGSVVPQNDNNLSMAVRRFGMYVRCKSKRVPEGGTDGDDNPPMTPKAKVDYALALENKGAYWQWGL
ncbi:hypothetical protein ACFQE1_05925 [Halobium palmae]|uniref:Replication protein n=1 Tax=Halobium palmae TaxID=1776492 RepID=A0ABD5RXE1_9EURY